MWPLGKAVCGNDTGMPLTTTPAPAGTPPAGASQSTGSHLRRPGAVPSTVRGSTTGEILGAPAPVAGTPPAAPGVAPVPAPAASAPAAGAPPAPAPAAPASAAGAAPVIGRGGAPIPPEKISDRVDRERRRLFREEYGTEDAAEVAKIRAKRKEDADRLQRFQSEEETRTREAMTAQQKLEADLAAERAKREGLEAQLRDMRESAAVSQQTTQLTEIAAKVIDPDLVEDALGRFQRHLRGLDVDQIKRLTPRAIERWFAKLVEDRPKFKLQPVAAPAGTPDRAPAAVAPPAAAPAKPVPRRVPLATSTAARGGVPRARPPAGPADPSVVGGKDVRPGRPNSMNRQELNEHLRARGLRPY